MNIHTDTYTHIKFSGIQYIHGYSCFSVMWVYFYFRIKRPKNESATFGSFFNLLNWTSTENSFVVAIFCFKVLWIRCQFGALWGKKTDCCKAWHSNPLVNTHLPTVTYAYHCTNFLNCQSWEAMKINKKFFRLIPYIGQSGECSNEHFESFRRPMLSSCSREAYPVWCMYTKITAVSKNTLHCNFIF